MMVRQVTYQKDDGTMKTKWIFREDADYSKDYSDFKTMENLLNNIYGAFLEANAEGSQDERGQDL